MASLGVIFSAVLRVSLSRVAAVVSPVAFGVLALVSIGLLLNVELAGRIPQVSAPLARRPGARAFLYGLFFGAVVLPCNPGLIAAFFATSLASSVGSYLLNLGNFVAFGLGLGLPLLALALLSSAWQRGIVSFLVAHRTAINRLAGGVMLAVSLYYLLAVFRILG